MVRGYVTLLGVVIIFILTALAVWNFTWIMNKIIELRLNRRKEFSHRPSDQGFCDYCHQTLEHEHEHVVNYDKKVMYHLHRDCKTAFEKMKL